MPSKTHYPGFSVLNEEHEWDPHTRKIVRSRLGPFGEPTALTTKQLRTLEAVLVQLVADDRPEILKYLVDHLNQQAQDPIGQAQRKIGTPSFAKLLLMGLDKLATYQEGQHGGSFEQLPPDEQFRLLQSVAQGSFQESTWMPDHQREFFTQLVSETVSAYYSHPWVWSSIGYAGPAYPRGYMRVELGLTEPWEAKLDGE